MRSVERVERVERRVQQCLQGMDQHLDEVFAFEEIVEPCLSMLME